ncbi:Uncharacterized protein PECH_008132 [Penicillium ucsense]|uniref:Histone acetyltransferase n=1 Tax=Penicillium ucsense TaxID=2839758 RepID=A0A8J8WKL5_9EURO|nr:Uncharacterized protein PECM_003315 [Penicillium ucsense]KAF7738761.1 Uncharacterized protein PECH_008132 [Penicillium ucsense]
MAAPVPPAIDDPDKLDPPADQADSDIDAEGEEETDLYDMDQQLQHAVHQAFSGEVAEENVDAVVQGEIPSLGNRYGQQNGGDNDETEPVGAVKLPSLETDEHDSEGGSENGDVESETADGEVDPAFEEENQRAASQSSESESGADEDWEGESNGHEDVEIENPSAALCIFCTQDEEHDPSEDFEEWFTCAVCGDHSHRQCAREQEAHNELEGSWRCPSCVQNNLQPDNPESPTTSKTKMTHLAKELLPAHSGKEEEGFHSIFDNNISDELLNSSRSLRKRKASSIEAEEHIPILRKRRRHNDLSDFPPPADGVGDEKLHDSGSPARHMRPRRTRAVDREHCRVVTKQSGKLILSFRLDESKMTKILSGQSRPSRKKRKQPQPPAVPQEVQAHFAPIPPTPYNNYYQHFHDREIDELKSKPYGGILTEPEADTSKTLPLQADREKFEQARQRAEEEWQRRVQEEEAKGETTPTASQKVSGPPSKIKYINFGGYEIETWYAAPYPEEYSRNRVLYICEFCLKYMNSDYVAWRHKLKCPAKHPPGDEIYRDGSVSIFEVDGRKNPVYCQNLCLLAKLFLGSKTLYYDVEPFLFYVMTECDDLGCHFVGYFSKEKRPSSANNVSCILTLPIHQRKGYGNLLIDFSYLLTRIEGKSGSPEKPLSDMGLVSYRNYWRLILSYQLRDLKVPVSIADLSDRTGMTADDLVSALEGLRALVRDPVTKLYALRLDNDYYEEVIAKWESKGYVQLNPEALTWTPYVMGRNNQSHFDRAPLHAVAPREDHEDEDEEELGTGGVADENAIPGGKGTDGLGAIPGPPSTAMLLQTNGTQQHESNCEPPESASPPDPAAGIPPSRFEIWPPIHVPAASRRKLGRPYGGLRGTISRTPLATRTSGRNTPRRASAIPGLVPNTSTPTTRRGRSAMALGSPAPDATPVQANGHSRGEDEEDRIEEDRIEEDGPHDPSLAELGLVVDDSRSLDDVGSTQIAQVQATDGSGEVQDELPIEPKVNGTERIVPESSKGRDNEAAIQQPPGSPQTPVKKGSSKSKSPESSPQKSEDTKSVSPVKSPQTVSRKTLIEKVQVVVSAEPEPAARRNSKISSADAARDVDSDVDAEGEDDDMDGEYEMDGDVVMGQ